MSVLLLKMDSQLEEFLKRKQLRLICISSYGKPKQWVPKNRWHLKTGSFALTFGLGTFNIWMLDTGVLPGDCTSRFKTDECVSNAN